MGSDNGIHCQYDESNIILRKRSDFNKGDIMERNILIGNGINIEFGGKDKYSNHGILQRMFANMRAGRYTAILPDCSID